MAAQSKAIEILEMFCSSYIEQMRIRPIRTKETTSCITTLLGHFTLQCFSKKTVVNKNSIVAFGLFGFMFGGPVPHFIHDSLDYIFPERSLKMVLIKFGIERLIFTPLYQYFSILVLLIFEGTLDNFEIYKKTNAIYWPILKVNWQIISVVQFINLTFVPLMLRLPLHNTISFFWAMFITYKKTD